MRMMKRRKRKGCVKGGRGRERATAGERERERRETVDLIRIKIQRDMCARGVYMCMCFKERQSVTPCIRISLHDSPPDQCARTHTHTQDTHFLLFYFSFTDSHTPSGGLQVSLSTFLHHLNNLQKTLMEILHRNNSSEKVREGKKDRKRHGQSGWRRKILALKYLKLLCGYI